MEKTDEKNMTEFLKAATEHFKHLTTLCSGFILIMAAFLEKFFQQPKWKVLVIISFGSFVISIASSVFAQAYFIGYLKQPSNFDTDKDESRSSTMTLSVITWSSFIIGVLSLIIFALKNFL